MISRVVKLRSDQMIPRMQIPIIPAIFRAEVPASQVEFSCGQQACKRERR